VFAGDSVRSTRLPPCAPRLTSRTAGARKDKRPPVMGRWAKLVTAIERMTSSAVEPTTKWRRHIDEISARHQPAGE